MLPPSFRSIDSARLRLRRFRDADLPLFLAYRNDPEVARYQDWEGTSEEEGRAFLAGQQDAQPGVPGQWFQFAIEMKATETVIGDCGLKVQGQDARQAEVGFTLARASQGQGYASEAVAAVLTYAFEVLELHRVTATVDCANTAAVAMLERLAFRREGHFLLNVWFKGRWGDEYLYALLRDEWRRRGAARAAPASERLVPGSPAEAALEYRSAQSQDAEAIRQFLSGLGWERRLRTPQRFRTLLEHSDRTVVAWEGNQIVGFGRALCDGVTNGYLSLVAVAPDRRRRGIGRELVRRLTGDDARLTWVLRAGRDSAGFWERLGFRPSPIAMEKTRAAD